jgi:hypothetical protein
MKDAQLKATPVAGGVDVEFVAPDAARAKDVAAKLAAMVDGKGCGCKEGGACKCGGDCKCKEGGACKCGGDCKCGQGGDCKCKEGGACKCGGDCKCGQGGDCKCKEGGACKGGGDCKCGQGGDCKCKEGGACKGGGDCKCGQGGDCKCKEGGACNCGGDCKCGNGSACQHAGKHGEGKGKACPRKQALKALLGMEGASATVQGTPTGAILSVRAASADKVKLAQEKGVALAAAASNR